VIPVRKPIGRFHVITDTVVQDRYGHAELARFAVAGGADTIQLRDKRLPDDEQIAAARETLAVCHGAGVPLIVDDRLNVASESNADGIHLGRLDVPIGMARQVLGSEAIIGGTAGSVEEAISVAAQGADYVGFGHIFATNSKAKEDPPVGTEMLAEVCAAVDIPVIAIGGITADNAGSVVEAGAWGIAVIGAVCGADDPEAAARVIAEAVER
jgi:thiamine-phosphate pyrophosphorylase